MEGLTVGHVLMAAAAADALVAIFYGSRWMRYSSELRGTPLYARGRDARRLAILLGGSVVVFLVLACLTPLRDIPLVGG